MPSLAVLRPGVVTVYEGDKNSKYFGRHVMVLVQQDSVVGEDMLSGIYVSE